MIKCTIQYTVFKFYLCIKIVGPIDKNKCFELQIIIIIIHNDAVLCIVMNRADPPYTQNTQAA